MTRFLQPLWLVLASATDSRLAQVVGYLKAENRILRDKLPERITVTARERERLIKFGSVLGSALTRLPGLPADRLDELLPDRWARDRAAPAG